MNFNKTKKSVTIDEETAEKTKKLADLTLRSFSQYVEHVLRIHIEEIETGKRLPD